MFDALLLMWTLGFAFSLLIALPSVSSLADPNENVSITWDVLRWTTDGYEVLVTISNFQKFRPIESPGWIYGWSWSQKEVIWEMKGARVTQQGDCSRFIGNKPLNCDRTLDVVDLNPSVPSTNKTSHCCRGGILKPFFMDPENSVSTFLVTVGDAHLTKDSVIMPRNFTLTAPGSHQYECGSVQEISTSKHALVTWKSTCVVLPSSAPTCCASSENSCVNSSPEIEVNWAVVNHTSAKSTIINHGYTNHTDWNLVLEHPDIEFSTASNFKFRIITHDSADYWGASGTHNNNVILSGRSVESIITFKSEVLLPKMIKFNGDRCMFL